MTVSEGWKEEKLFHLPSCVFHHLPLFLPSISNSKQCSSKSGKRWTFPVTSGYASSGSRDRFLVWLVPAFSFSIRPLTVLLFKEPLMGAISTIKGKYTTVEVVLKKSLNSSLPSWSQSSTMYNHGQCRQNENPLNNFISHVKGKWVARKKIIWALYPLIVDRHCVSGGFFFICFYVKVTTVRENFPMGILARWNIILLDRNFSSLKVSHLE